MEFINASGQVFNTIHANNVEFYDELHTVIDREPIDMIDPETRGLLASIGIRKGQPFEPDDALRAILIDAGGRRQRHRTGDVLQHAGAGQLPVRGQLLEARLLRRQLPVPARRRSGVRNLDARTAFFYMATVNTPAMAAKMIGRGSQYAWGDRDSTGNYLDGANNYRLHIPADVPAKNFWSLVVYDPQTRSELQTGQPFPSKNNAKGGLTDNADGSVDLYFGPAAARATTRRTGSRPFPARAGSPSCASTAPSTPGSTRPGDPAKSNRAKRLPQRTTCRSAAQLEAECRFPMKAALLRRP